MLLASGIAAAQLLPSDYPDSVVGSIPVGGDPTNIVCLPSGDFLYVANETDNRVTVIKVADRQVVARVAAGSAPWEVTCSPDGRFVYAAELGSNAVGVISTATNTLVATVPTGGGPCLMAVTPDGAFVYATNSSSNSVSVIRTSDNHVIASVSVGSNPRGATCLPDGSRVYIGNNYSDDVSVIRTSDNTVVATIPVGGGAHRVAATLDGDYVYASLYGENKVAVIRTADNTVERTITVGGAAVGITMLPGTSYAYVACSGSNSVSVIRTTDHTVVTSVPVGHAPWGVTFPLSANFAYTADRYSDAVTIIARRRSYDVAAVELLAPSGTMDSGTTVVPRAVVRNNGAVSVTFPVTMRIGAGYSRTVNDTLSSGASDTVSFPAWTASPVGDLPVVCFTALIGDTFPANDTVRDTVRVMRVAPVDVAVNAILAPAGTVDSGRVLTPQAVVENRGTDTAEFPITFRIGATYAWVQPETLAAGESDTVSFPDWTASPLGNFPVICYTALAGDQNPANDTLRGSVTVERPLTLDVGVLAILAPQGTVDSNSVIAPLAIVRNLGTTDTVFAVTLLIGDDYSSTVTETLAARTSDTVGFVAWTPVVVGVYDIKCYTGLADENPANDTLRDSVTVIGATRHDVGPDSMLMPGATAYPGETINPQVRIHNWGNQTERYFDVALHIGTTYTSTKTVLAPIPMDGSTIVTFDPWVTEPGNYYPTAMTLLGSDANRHNDTLNSATLVFGWPGLVVEWDQSDVIKVGEGKTYRFWAEVQGDIGDTVRLIRPEVPAGWSLNLYDSAGVLPVSTLGFLPPYVRGWFCATVRAPASLAGDTGAINTSRFVIAGHTTRDTMTRDSAILTLTVAPELEVHNFPNPMQSLTTFIIGLPYAGTLTLTVFNRAGEVVAHLLDDESFAAGVHKLLWDATTDGNLRVAPGTYEYILDYSWQGNATRLRKKLVVTKERP